MSEFLKYRIRGKSYRRESKRVKSLKGSRGFELISLEKGSLYKNEKLPHSKKFFFFFCDLIFLKAKFPHYYQTHSFLY